MYSLTIFKNTFDNKTHRTMEFASWESFESLLYKLSLEPGQKGGKDSSALITPAVYEQGTTRSNRNVEQWGKWCCVDVDEFTDTRLSVHQELQSICGSYKFVCYSTASSTPIQPKFRLVFPLTREIVADEIPHFWHALNKMLGDIGDRQTKDLSRMYYVPAVYPDAFNFIFSNDGKEMNPDALMKAWPYEKPTGNSFLDRLPPALRDQVVSYRRSQATNTDIAWTSYKDCPFFPKRLAQEYVAITGTGWYSKMYAIMVAVAANAVKADYPITAKQIADMCRELDNETGKWYDNRPLEKEADGAIEYVYRN